MTGIVLFSHGSVLCGAGGALESHAARLRSDYGFLLVEVGYLNYSEPIFAEAVARLSRAGATEIVIVPFFLSPGYFVTHSLPKCVGSVRPSFPDIELLIAAPLGADPCLADALLESAVAAQTSEHWRAGLAEALTACRANPECPLYGKECNLCPSSLKEMRTEDCGATGPSPRMGRGVPEGRGEGQRAEGHLYKDALLVMVHGSPKPEANREMFQVVEKIRRNGAYPIVEVGFLECNEPAIPQAIEACIRQGTERIAAVPYFLHMGAHVAQDLPALLEAGAARWPNIEFRMGEYIGKSEKLTKLLAVRANEALEQKKEKQYAR